MKSFKYNLIKKIEFSRQILAIIYRSRFKHESQTTLILKLYKTRRNPFLCLILKYSGLSKGCNATRSPMSRRDKPDKETDSISLFPKFNIFTFKLKRQDCFLWISRRSQLLQRFQKVTGLLQDDDPKSEDS